jgi:glycogen debranching enzyme
MIQQEWLEADGLGGFASGTIFLTATQGKRSMISQGQKKSLQEAVEAILTGYSQGTRYGIRMDQDGLLAAGVSGIQLTWMDHCAIE